MHHIIAKYPTSSLVDRAARFAYRCHAGQKRKYTGGDYIDHPLAVALAVSVVTDDEAVIAAALLHDVIEDCGVSEYKLSALFGNKVAAFVSWLTHVDPRSGELRAARKTRDRAKLRMAPPAVKTVKLADMIDNSASIIKHDPKFARVFMEEMRLMLEVLGDGNPELYAQAEKIVEDYYEYEMAKI